MNNFKKGRQSPIKVIAGMAILASAQAASALTFNATFGNDGSTGNFSAADISCINSVLSLYSATFTDPITVNVRFNNSASGLGGSSTAIVSDSWTNVKAQLVADASSADDTAALAQLNASPIAGTTTFAFSTANAKALGYTGLSGTDSTISLNAGICFNQHTAAGAAANRRSRAASGGR